MTTKQLLANSATALLVLCALLISAVTVRRELSADSSPRRFRLVSSEKKWATYSTTGHVMGPGTAAVTIVEFSDIECPFCAQFAAYVDSLRSLGADLRVVYRHFPGARHKHAVPAVRASECADEQGKFEGMHAALFRGRDSLGAVPWWWFAKQAGLQDCLRFNACMAQSGPIAALDRDTMDARRLGARGTPTLLIHDIRLNGLPSFDSLRVYVDRVSKRDERRSR